jgi:protein-S-isoprenylcysteine O-methyltransferase Ste14
VQDVNAENPQTAMHRAATLFAHLVFILTPILLGWGLTDLPAFFREPVRTLLLVAISLGSLSILLLRIDLNPLRTSEFPPCGQTLALTSMAVASVALLWFLPFADRRQILAISIPTLRWVGLALCCLGGAIRILALRQLGPQFSAYVTLQPDHRLVQSGIYSVVRHPLYLSLLLAGPGLALVFASQLVWPILIATLMFVRSRVHAEDALLAQAFAPEFDAYRASTPALLPLL